MQVAVVTLVLPLALFVLSVELQSVTLWYSFAKQGTFYQGVLSGYVSQMDIGQALHQFAFQNVSTVWLSYIIFITMTIVAFQQSFAIAQGSFIWCAKVDKYHIIVTTSRLVVYWSISHFPCPHCACKMVIEFGIWNWLECYICITLGALLCVHQITDFPNCLQLFA